MTGAPRTTIFDGKARAAFRLPATPEAASPADAGRWARKGACLAGPATLLWRAACAYRRRDIEDSPASDGLSPAVASALATRAAEDCVAPLSPETALHRPDGFGAPSDGLGLTTRRPTAGPAAGRSDIAIWSLRSGAGGAPAGRVLPTSASARQYVADVRRRAVRQTGGVDGVTAGGMPGAGPWDPTSQNGEGAAKPALPIRPKARHRPDRLHFQPSARGTAASCRPRRRAMKHEEDAA